jgi:predicted histone-like DNA-binding protein
MAIPFKVIKKGNPLKPKENEQYYAKAIGNGAVDFEMLTNILAEKSRLHKADCFKILSLLEETINQQLKNGKIVRLGTIGSFQVGITSSGADTASKIKSSAIKNAKVNFRAGKSLQKMLKELEYEKVKG